MINDQEIIKLFKFSLLVPPNLANVEHGFSVLSLLVVKLRISISPYQSINTFSSQWTKSDLK